MAFDELADRQYDALARRRPAVDGTACADCGAPAIADVDRDRSYCSEHYRWRSAANLLWDRRSRREIDAARLKAAS